MLFAFKKEKIIKLNLQVQAIYFSKKVTLTGNWATSMCFLLFFFFVGKALKLCH